MAGDSDPITVDTTHLERGILIKFPVNELPVFVLNRRVEEIADLEAMHKTKKEPVRNCPDCNTVLRSITDNILVIWGFNPSTGCELLYASSKDDGFDDLVLIDRGGFVDSCSHAVFDLSGRKLSGSDSTPKTLEVPAHKIYNGVIEIDRMAYPEHPTNSKT